MSRVDWMLLRNANALCRATPGRDAAGKSCGGSLQKMGAGRGAGGGVHNQVGVKAIRDLFIIIENTGFNTTMQFAQVTSSATQIKSPHNANKKTQLNESQHNLTLLFTRSQYLL